MALTPGTKLGPYEIQSPLGAGGMGEVYSARDTRLERTVAIKVLPSHLSSDPDRRQRLEREAKAVSKLSHPHICTLYDIGHQDGIDFLVMELVEGETLAQRLLKGPLPLEQTVRYGAQVADALAKAHKLGITHRDLKPANIILTKSGAKLMDFGLAKQSGVVPLATAPSQMTAEQSRLTKEGTIVGTFQYMAPEQLEGKEADARTDIFALGEVIYEMATGQPAFAGKSSASLIAAILSSEPQPMATLQPLTPPALERLVKKCLAKDADERWQNAADLSSELSWFAESGGQSAAIAPASARKSREALAWLVAGALAVILIVGAIWWRSSKPPEETKYFPAPLPFSAHDVALAPNGHTLAVVAYQEASGKNVIWTYEVGSQGGRILNDTEGATYPFWSPDGRTLGFFKDGKLKKLDLAGGSVQTLCDAPSGRGGTWNKDGVIVFTPEATLGPGRGLYRVSASGGAPTRISEPDTGRGEQSHRWPVFLPDGKHYLYMAANFTGQKGVNAIFVGALDSNEKHFVMEASANVAYAAPGYLLFPREKTLLAQRFDPTRFALTGEPTTILPDVQYQPQVRRAVFAISDNGLLIAQKGGGVALSQPLWFDRKGKELGTAGRSDVYGNVFLAPNGRSVAVDKTDMASLNTDVWAYDLQRESAKRLTFDLAFDVVPIWSPDGSRLVFASNRQLNVDLYVKNSDGAQEEHAIVHDEFNKIPNSWSADGKCILYTRGPDLWFLTLPELKSRLFLKAVSILRNGQFSPDGKWVAYASNETGNWEIYVTSFPDARGKWQISTGGGEQPRWRGDGKELFFLSSDSRIMVAAVTTGANFDASSPVALFQATPRQPVSTNDQFVYDVSRDGQRFLFLTQVKQTETVPMSVVLNWTATLNK
jgi:eukaryotic-like serine/threonine-protein kinase